MLETSPLLELGKELKRRGYRFVAVTPATHSHIYSQAGECNSLGSIFGWNRPFGRGDIDPQILTLLAAANALEPINERLLKSRIRFATLGDLIFVHSAFPTRDLDSVFFGPDTYRFARAIQSSLKVNPFASRSQRIVDVGAGSGAGGIFAASLLSGPTEVVLADINQKALEFATVNAALNNCESAISIRSDILSKIDGDADLIVANPPYLVDPEKRCYRDGGGYLGMLLPLRMAEESIGRLKAGGRLILYTGAPVVAGEDLFFQALRPSLQLSGFQYSYEEIDPDVFGDELEGKPYATVERIAAVVLNVMKE